MLVMWAGNVGRKRKRKRKRNREREREREREKTTKSAGQVPRRRLSLFEAMMEFAWLLRPDMKTIEKCVNEFFFLNLNRKEPNC